MDTVTHAARLTGDPARDDAGFDLTFLPKTLMGQCRSLIESYHEVHGFASLPNMLWQFRMGPLIERHKELRQLLRKASTTRSAKKANEGFVQITTTILALEILASSFAGWNAIYPVAGEAARDVLQRNAHGAHMALMDFYLYPPKQISAAAIATLAPPASRSHDDTGLHHASRPELSGERRALQYASMIRNEQDSAARNAAAP